MKGNKTKCHSRVSLSGIPAALNNAQGGDARLQASGMTLRKGFTLIELLVVVLIIGILAAIALPAYQKSIVRSRGMQIKQLVRVIAEAEKSYYMEHGKYAANFKDLDIDIPLTPVKTTVGGKAGACNTVVQGTDSVRSSNDFYIALNNSTDDRMTWIAVVGYWGKGKYKCSGFGIVPSGTDARQQKLFCAENKSATFYKGGVGAFCEKVEHSTLLDITNSSWRYYKLP